MSLYDSAYCGSIWHHGIKGQKWGVRRTPEQLGHRKKSQNGDAKTEKRATIVDGIYQSEKGFTIAVAKLAKYCLKPGTDHADEFYSVGYKVTDSDRLFRDIEREFHLDKKKDVDLIGRNKEKFSLFMNLGVTKKRLFRTVWLKDEQQETPKFITAYIDRRAKGEQYEL